MPELPKAYEPQKYEDTIYKRWEESGFFNPDVCIEKGVTDKNASPFSIVLPPPNVTGTLHIGHAVMLAVEDVIVRYHRMKGDRTLWIPGTDHAAIATQTKVEKILYDTEKKTRHDLGREEFLRRVEDFAQKSHDTIVNQAKKMGTSMDWSREAYTLDAKRNFAVRTAFKKMYDDGLIYRGDRIVNWDPKMQSNVSDIEVEAKEEQTKFYYFQYGPFVIGTARPETKFGDKYVVMHPDDERYSDYKDGQTFELEWINGPITATVIKDAAVDMIFGSGVMTITPWHDMVDFEIAERHGLDKEQVIDLNGRLLPIAGEFVGMEITEAREKIVEKLQRKGLVVRIEENYIHNIGVNSRGGCKIEPQIMKQWFVDTKKTFIRNGKSVTLKDLMLQAVQSGEITILPERSQQVYFNWVENLRDWCVSRQLWYGHRLPVWYKGEETYVGIEAPGGDGWEQDSDTLDTWFSAGLWTFSTLGWPEMTEDLKTYHPTTVLETGYDILFFWVVRMVLMSTYLMGEIPFKTVYLHGLVRDEKGRKMSKSLDNIIDPLDMIAKFGTDATRLSLLIGATPGNDSRLSEEKIAGFRNFTNKLWNISRFILLNISEPKKDIVQPEPKTLADQWILSRLNETIKTVTENIEKYNFSYAGEALRDFTWNDLADWYLEIAKIEGQKFDILNYILNTILKLWHPYMPFVTETIWEEVYGGGAMLMVEKWPAFVPTELLRGKPDFSVVQTIITGIRATRAEHKIEPAKLITAYIKTGETYDWLEDTAAIIRGLARIESLTIAVELEKPANSVGFVERGIEVYIDLSGAVDSEKEKTRLEKEIAMVAPYVESLKKKLSNQEFVQNAPPAVVAIEQKKLAEAEEKLGKLLTQLQQL